MEKNTVKATEQKAKKIVKGKRQQTTADPCMPLF
jgi:hypothetical protein